MAAQDEKDDLTRYLCVARDALVWKLGGLGDYDMRRPLVPTGTNLLGLVKHLAATELFYFGECFRRPLGEQLAWMSDDAEANADMWATADESSAWILDVYARARIHADETIAALELDATGEVPWWPPERRNPTLRLLLVHMIAETNRHAGHADIVRELIDGEAGLRAGMSNLPSQTIADWAKHRVRLEAVARQIGGG